MDQARLGAGQLADQPYRYTKEWAAKQLEDVFAMKFGKKERDFMHRADLPPDNVFLLRITAGLHSVLAALGATIDFRRSDPNCGRQKRSR